MSGSINKATLVGRVGADPEIKTFDGGGRLAQIRLATTDTWKDKATGERKEKTEWHTIVVRSDGLVGVVQSYVKKGGLIYVEGQIQSRKYDKNGTEMTVSEIVLSGPGHTLTMLGDAPGEGGGSRGQSSGGGSGGGSSGGARGGSSAPRHNDGFADDDVPF